MERMRKWKKEKKVGTKGMKESRNASEKTEEWNWIAARKDSRLEFRNTDS